MNKQVKVSDIIKLTEAEVQMIGDAMKRLDDLTKEYQKTDSLGELEDLKRRYNAELHFFTKLLSKTLLYKGSNHTYLELESKMIKAQAVDLLLQSGMKITQAESQVYNSDYYISRMEVVQNITSFFIKVEKMYKRYDYTLTCIVQSVSIEGKEFSNVQKTA